MPSRSKIFCAALAKAEPLADDELPPRTARGAPLGKEGTLVADLLKLLLKIRAREIDASARLLARSEELELLAGGVRNLPMLEGWRFKAFGKDALELVEGKLAFAVLRNKLKMTHIDEIHEGMREEAAGVVLSTDADAPVEDEPMADEPVENADAGDDEAE